MMPLSLSLNQTATSGSKNSQDGAAWGSFGSGDFYANIGGNGTALQSGGGMSPLLLAAIALGVIWLLKKH
jgi:hypothetical protein